MYNTYLMSEEEYELCKLKMDKNTFEHFIRICDEIGDKKGVPLSIIHILSICKGGSYSQNIAIHNTRKNQGLFYKLYLRNRNVYNSLNMIILYTIYGYGNTSNNDRAKNGLAPIRFRKKVKV